MPYLVTISLMIFLVIIAIPVIDPSGSFTETHRTLIEDSVIHLMLSIQCARGLPLFLVPPPIPNINGLFKTILHDVTKI